MDTDSSMSIVILAFLILCSAFFSASETAYSTFNKIRMKNLANEGHKRAILTLKLHKDYDRLLSTILIGNNIVNIGAASLATVFFTRHYGDIGATISTLFTTILVLIFGEISPKSMAKESPEQFALFSAGILNILVYILLPFTFLFTQWKKILRHFYKSADTPSYTDEELITIVDEAQNEGILDEHEFELIRSAIEFDDLNAGDVAIPRVEITAIDIATPLEEIDRIFATNGYSRLPVYKETIDNIVGMIHEKDFHAVIRNKLTSIKTILSTVIFASENTKISYLLKQLQKSKTHMAIIVDEFGGTFGLVTMEDIIEELVGDIWDEHDEIVESFKTIDEETTLVACQANLIDMFEFFDVDFQNKDLESNTVNGWIIECLGHIPNIGESFSYKNLDIIITQATLKTVTEIKVTKNAHSKSEISERISHENGHSI